MAVSFDRHFFMKQQLQFMAKPFHEFIHFMPSRHFILATKLHMDLYTMELSAVDWFILHFQSARSSRCGSYFCPVRQKYAKAHFLLTVVFRFSESRSPPSTADYEAGQSVIFLSIQVLPALLLFIKLLSACVCSFRSGLVFHS